MRFVNAPRRACARHSTSTRSRADSMSRQGSTVMLYTLAIVLIALWLLGLVSSYTMGGFVHILLVIAIVLLLVRIIGGRRRLA